MKLHSEESDMLLCVVLVERVEGVEANKIVIGGSLLPIYTANKLKFCFSSILLLK